MGKVISIEGYRKKKKLENRRKIADKLCRYAESLNWGDKSDKEPLGRKIHQMKEKCVCQSETEDDMNGEGIRIFEKENSDDEWVCTTCGKVLENKKAFSETKEIFDLIDGGKVFDAIKRFDRTVE